MVCITKIKSDADKIQYLNFFSTIEKIWNLPAEEFNEWRRKNDLPILYRNLKRELPKFQEWLDNYQLTYEEHFLTAPHTGDLFAGTGEYEFVEYLIKDVKKHIITKAFDSDKHISFRKKFDEIKIISKRTFIPYLCWAERNLGEDLGGKLQYNQWEGDESSQPSSAILFHSFKVRKLGQIRLSNIPICDRNLDFIDLDHLEFSGNFRCSGETKINFSSCRGWNIHSSGIGVTIRYCNLGQFKCSNSSIWLNCYKCRIWEPSFIDTDITGMSFDKCDLLYPSFERCDIVPYNFHYIPAIKEFRFFGEKENYRIFRHAFQSIGQMSEAKKYFYLEKKYERKDTFVGIVGHDIYSNILKKLIDIKENFFEKKFVLLLKHIWEKIIGHHVYAKTILICNYIISLFDNLLWG
ncbi:MAG: hypothetical protein D3909_16335, partial [Candidatus Electrothrix sp. ATG1]|nr:hypothetical protein [Candidatus Electrothrix sp. ATG1]